MQGWIIRTVSRISVSPHVSLDIGLYSAAPENTALTVTNEIDSLEETKTTFCSKHSNITCR